MDARPAPKTCGSGAATKRRWARRPGRERGTVMKSSRWKTARHFGIEMTVNGSTPS
jgi:hypothetical protein